VNLPANLPEYVYLLALAIPVFTTWITVRAQRKQESTLRRVDEQVSNTHDTNLRDDITAIHNDVRLIRAEMLEMRKFDAHVLAWMAARGGDAQ